MIRSILALALISTVSMAQEVGSRQAARALAESQQQAFEEEFAWKQAKKIKEQPGFEIKHPWPENLNIANFQEEDIGFIDAWSLKIWSIVDEKSFVVVGEDPDRTKLLVLHSSKGLADKESVRLLGPIKVLSTKKIDGMTIKTIRFLNAEEAETFKKAEQEKARLKTIAESEKDFSVFKNTSGKEIGFFKVIEAKNNFVTFEDKEGKRRKFDFRKLDAKSKTIVIEKIGPNGTGLSG